ncbi:MAG: RlmE family RNA methyltransferase [Rickettsiales bacterium]|jgi:23S rRNA (uridine2552-2'-O)-methyltransferase|nr:RlmE family RNA methyltransferase [Rickettsiales bacterium]
MPRITNKKIASKKSSAQWMSRQLTDPFVAKAKAEGYRCRAAYKIAEIDEKLRLFKPGQVVVDLGSAPGGWSQYIAKKYPKTRVLAMDLLEMKKIPYSTTPSAAIAAATPSPAKGTLEQVEFWQGDFTSDEAVAWLNEKLGGRKVDVVLSDMAPNTTGHQKTDHLRQMVLLEYAWDFARENLAQGGAFVAKSFTGGTTNELLAQIKPAFAKVQHIKPESSRKESVEMFIVATGFKAE